MWRSPGADPLLRRRAGPPTSSLTACRTTRVVDVARPLVSGAIAFTGIGRWVTTALYDTGRARSQEAQKARLAKAGWLDRVLKVVTFPLKQEQAAGGQGRQDLRPGSWAGASLLLVGSIVVICLVSVAALPVDRSGPWMGPGTCWPSVSSASWALSWPPSLRDSCSRP